MKKLTYLFSLIFLIMLFGCYNINNEMVYMTELKKNISETYNIESIDITIMNKKILRVSINDSKFNDYNHQKKEEFAKKIGELAQSLRENLPNINSGVLVFIDNSNFGIVKTSKSETFKMY